MKIDEENVKISMVKGTVSGVEQLETHCYFQGIRWNRPTLTTCAGIEFDMVDGSPVIKSTEAGAWIVIRNIPKTGYFYDCLDMEIKGTGKVEVHVDKINSKPLFVFEAKKQRNYKSLQFPNFDFSGNKDMYFIFTEKDIYLYSWFLIEFIP